MVKPLDPFSETEIRLRICKLLKVYDLTKYQQPFASVTQVMETRAKNQQAGKDRGEYKLGVWLNRPEEDDAVGSDSTPVRDASEQDTFHYEFFARKRQ